MWETRFVNSFYPFYILFQSSCTGKSLRFRFRKKPVIVFSLLFNTRLLLYRKDWRIEIQESSVFKGPRFYMGVLSPGFTPNDELQDLNEYRGRLYVLSVSVLEYWSSTCFGGVFFDLTLLFKMVRKLPRSAQIKCGW